MSHVASPRGWLRPRHSQKCLCHSVPLFHAESGRLACSRRGVSPGGGSPPTSRVEPETDDRDIAASVHHLRLPSSPPPGETPVGSRRGRPLSSGSRSPLPPCSLAEADQQTKCGGAVIARGVGYRLSGMRVEMRRHREPSLRTLPLKGRVLNPGPSPPFPHQHSHPSAPAFPPFRTSVPPFRTSDPPFRTSVPTVPHQRPHCSGPASPLFRTSVPTVPDQRPHCSGPASLPFRTCVPTVPHECPHCSAPVSPLFRTCVPTVPDQRPYCSGPASHCSAPASPLSDVRPRCSARASRPCRNPGTTLTGCVPAMPQPCSLGAQVRRHVLAGTPWRLPVRQWVSLMLQPMRRCSATRALRLEQIEGARSAAE